MMTDPSMIAAIRQLAEDVAKSLARQLDLTDVGYEVESYSADFAEHRYSATIAATTPNQRPRRLTLTWETDGDNIYVLNASAQI